MRKANDICLLCRENNSNQTNSHILPKFMTTTLFATSNGNRGFYNSSDKVKQAPQVVQDGDKENYILCQDCEKYFSILENYISLNFYRRFQDIRFSKQFIISKTKLGLEKVCKEVDSIIFRLFIYSIIWRSSVSNSKTFKNFKLKQNEEELLRESLLKFRNFNQKELLSDIKNFGFGLHQIRFGFLSCESFSRVKGRLVFCHPNILNPYFFMLNEFILIFSFNDNNRGLLSNYLNNFNSNESVIIIELPLESWQGVLDKLVESYGNKLIYNAKLLNEIPYVIKKAIRN